MLITKIEPGKNKRFRVFGEDTFLFALYGKELKHYHIEENMMLDDAIISSILDEIIYKRAKERALYLLERRPLTLFLLRDKLRKNDYPEEVINKVIQFLENYHYLDDEDYVRMYVAAYGNRKSKQQMVYDLVRKGISKTSIDSFFEQTDYSEQTCFEEQFQRYIRGKDLEDRMVRQKVFRYFYGKGFAVSLIESMLKEYSD